MVNIDYKFDMALGCFLEDTDELIATGGYFYESTEHTGEIAFMVRPDLQNEGIATFLHDYLFKIAKQRGLRGFKAYVLKNNKPMLSVFHKAGYKINMMNDYDSNVIELELIFNYKEASSTGSK